MRDPALSIGFAPCPICGADLDTFVTDPETHCRWRNTCCKNPRAHQDEDCPNDALDYEEQPR